MLNKLKQIIKSIYINNFNLQEVSSATLGIGSLWDSTGHNTHYKSNIYTLTDTNLSLKPMNCPMHIEIIKKLYKKHSVLPIGLFEFNYCFRHEASGALGGIFRLTRFTQDDAHIVLALDQMEAYIENFLNNVFAIYKKFDLSIHLRFSKTDADYMGSDDTRNQSEAIIQRLLDAKFSDYSVTNDGAFYGPKLDIIAKDMQDRAWQLGTIQIDLNTLTNLKFTMQNNDCISKYGILHHAMLGTFERFLGVVLENAGQVPAIINPYDTIVIVLNYSEKATLLCAYYQQLQQIVDRANVDFDISTDSIQNKIKAAHLLKYNNIFICGGKEAQAKILSVHKASIEMGSTLSLENFAKIYHK